MNRAHAMRKKIDSTDLLCRILCVSKMKMLANTFMIIIVWVINEIVYVYSTYFIIHSVLASDSTLLRIYIFITAIMYEN